MAVSDHMAVSDPLGSGRGRRRGEKDRKQPVPKSFVILYKGREGSSPIIDLLSRHPAIEVPIFEQLDNYVARDYCDPRTVSRLASYTLRYADFAKARAAFAEGCEEDPRNRALSVGFKWRIWGDVDSVADMLAENEAVVFHLFRRDLDRMALSLYFTGHVIPEFERERKMDLMGGGHLQFKFATLPEAEQREVKAALRSIAFSVDRDIYLEIARDIVVGKRDTYEKYIEPIIARGTPVYAMFYEDFLERKTEFLRSICSLVDVDVNGVQSEESFFKRVNDADLTRQATNWDEIDSLPAVVELRSRYEDLIAKHPRPADHARGMQPI
jgi:hypothetical protein